MKNLKYMKKLIFILIWLVSPLVYGQFSGGGNGTEQNPWGIKTLDDLYKVSQYQGHFKVLNLIKDSVRVPIEKLENSTFDGQGFEICLAIDETNEYFMDPRALFIYVVGDVVIKNVIVSGYVKSHWASGILCSAHSGVGTTSLSIEGCINMAEISGIYCASGIVHDIRSNIPVIIDRCINLGNCILLYEEINIGCASGILAHYDFLGEYENFKNFIFSNCINAGIIKGKHIAAGFIANETYRHSKVPINTISNCINIGIIEGDNFIDPFLTNY